MLETSENVTVAWDPETRKAAIAFKIIGLADSGKYTCITYSDVGGHATTSSVVQVRGKLLVNLFYINVIRI